jgi:hypothetical protein
MAMDRSGKRKVVINADLERLYWNTTLLDRSLLPVI